MRNGVRYIEQRTVTRYAKAKARITKLDKFVSRVRLEILDQVNDGYRCPKSGPYVLEVLDVESRAVDWKEEAHDLAKQLFGKSYKQKWENGLDEKYPKRQSQTVLVKVNPDYRIEDDNKVAV